MCGSGAHAEPRIRNVYVVVGDTSHLEPAAVLSMNTFDDWGGAQHYRELDVEMSRWGDAANKNNAQYGIQPFYIPGNVFLLLGRA